MVDVAYEMVEGIAVFRLTGSHGMEEGVRRVREVILRAKQDGIGKLLVDITAISMGPPTVDERYWIMREWAIAGRGAVRLALVIRPEFIDPQQFGTAVARNHGLDFKGFTDEQRAVDWLLGRLGRKLPPESP